MYCVNIALGNTVWRLLFKDEEKAQAAYMQASNFDPTICISVEDDYGQRLSTKMVAVSGVMFEDLDKAKMANVELFLHQQRVQVMATKAAQSDPGLRAASMMNGPRVIDAMGGMPRPQ